jgi:hypothetical protein
LIERELLAKRWRGQDSNSICVPQSGSDSKHLSPSSTLRRKVWARDRIFSCLLVCNKQFKFVPPSSRATGVDRSAPEHRVIIATNYLAQLKHALFNPVRKSDHIQLSTSDALGKLDTVSSTAAKIERVCVCVSQINCSPCGGAARISKVCFFVFFFLTGLSSIMQRAVILHTCPFAEHN